MSLSPALVDSVLALLGHPVVAGVLGIAVGAGLLLVSRASFSTVSPDDPFRGLVIAAILLFARLAFATLAIVAYQHFVPAGFAAFGIMLAASFLVMYLVELVRYAGLHRYARPAAGSRDGR